VADAVSIYHPREQFLPFHEREERWAALVCHRRAGKTVAGVNELIERALHTDKEDARYSYIAPFYAQAKAVAWDYLLKFSAPFRKRANIAELSVDLFNGSRCRLFGGDNPDALRGLYHDGVLLDEPAQMKPRLWPEIIRPALSDRKGWAVFMGTPQGKNEFWEICEQAKKGKDWFFMLLKASESGILDDEELAAAKEMMDEDEYAQEYECSFDAAIRGSFYGKLVNAMAGRLGHFPYVDGFRVHTCWDLGYTDDTVIWFFQVIDKRPVFFDCYSGSGQSLDHYCDVLHAKRMHYGLTYGEYYLPHDARAHSLQTGRSVQEDLMKRQIYAKIIPDLGVQDGIQATRKMIEVCCIDEENCATGIEALKQYQREWNEDKKAFSARPRHDWTSHYADGFRMGAIGWQEDYGNVLPYVPPSKRAKPNITEGMQLTELWKTLPVRRFGNRRI